MGNSFAEISSAVYMDIMRMLREVQDHPVFLHGEAPNRELAQANGP